MSWQVRMQADDFFNAYQVLKKNYETASLAIMGPSIVCLAFALELYLKEIYCALGKKIPISHDILKLFEGLPEKIRQEIFAHDLISQNPFYTRGDIWSIERFNKDFTPYDGFVDQIKAIGNSFKEWRYAHEHRALRYETGFSEALIVAVKSVTDGIRNASAA